VVRSSRFAMLDDSAVAKMRQIQLPKIPDELAGREFSVDVPLATDRGFLAVSDPPGVISLNFTATAVLIPVEQRPASASKPRRHFCPLASASKLFRTAGDAGRSNASSAVSGVLLPSNSHVVVASE